MPVYARALTTYTTSTYVYHGVCQYMIRYVFYMFIFHKTVSEAPSEEPKITATEISDSVPMMFVVARSPSPVLEQLSRFLPGCGRFPIPFNLLHQLRWS
jgi:hypothetical protein